MMALDWREKDRSSSKSSRPAFPISAHSGNPERVCLRIGREVDLSQLIGEAGKRLTSGSSEPSLHLIQRVRKKVVERFYADKTEARVLHVDDDVECHCKCPRE